MSGSFRLNVFQQRDCRGCGVPYHPFRDPLPRAARDAAVGPPICRLAAGPRARDGPDGVRQVDDSCLRSSSIINSTKTVQIIRSRTRSSSSTITRSRVVNQREVGEDTESVRRGPASTSLRQDPDVILIGEMRDLETISMALTRRRDRTPPLRAPSTPRTHPSPIDRMIDVFPAHQQQQIRAQLVSTHPGRHRPSNCCRARAAAASRPVEFLLATPAVGNLIREGKTHQVYGVMEAGAKFGMQSMDQGLADMVKGGIVTWEVAEERCAHVEDLRRLIGVAV